MELEVWIGLVEVRQLPGKDQKITLSGKELSHGSHVGPETLQVSRVERRKQWLRMASFL